MALAAMLVGLIPSQAQRIQGGDRPGRERDRFIANPAERLMTQPQPATSPLPHIDGRSATKPKTKLKPKLKQR
ncbi:MAG: hypothetical protein WCG92_17270 [Hyphomicrobiales bacterium]|nr:hypothetical protein [Alphaproteobacteria bacterium]